MSKIKNDGLTRSGTGCFIAIPVWHQWASKDWSFLVGTALYFARESRVASITETCEGRGMGETCSLSSNYYGVKCWDTTRCQSLYLTSSDSHIGDVLMNHRTGLSRPVAGGWWVQCIQEQAPSFTWSQSANRIKILC